MGFWFYMLVHDGDPVRFHFEIDGGNGRMIRRPPAQGYQARAPLGCDVYRVLL